MHVNESGEETFDRFLGVEEAQVLKRESGDRERIIALDIDQAKNRYRLWSINDNQIGYYLEHLGESLEIRRRYNKYVSRGIRQRKDETRADLVQKLMDVGLPEKAEEVKRAGADD